MTSIVKTSSIYKFDTGIWIEISKNLKGQEIARLGLCCKSFKENLFKAAIFAAANVNDKGILKAFLLRNVRLISFSLLSENFSGNLETIFFGDSQILIAGKTALFYQKLKNAKKEESLPPPDIKSILSKNCDHRLALTRVDKDKMLVRVKDKLGNTNIFQIFDTKIQTCVLEKKDVKNSLVVYDVPGKIIYHSKQSNALEIWDISRTPPEKQTSITPAISAKALSILLVDNHLIIYCKSNEIFNYDLDKASLFHNESFVVNSPRLTRRSNTGDDTSIFLKKIGEKRFAIINTKNNVIAMREVDNKTPIGTLKTEIIHNDWFPLESTEEFLITLMLHNKKREFNKGCIRIADANNLKILFDIDFKDSKIHDFKIINSNFVFLHSDKENNHYLDLWEIKKGKLIKTHHLGKDSYKMKFLNENFLFIEEETIRKEKRGRKLKSFFSVSCFDLQAGTLHRKFPAPNNQPVNITWDKDCIFMSSFIKNEEKTSELHVYNLNM